MERESGAAKGFCPAEQGLHDPERALDSETGQNLFWGCVKNNWADAKTGIPLGFQGTLGKNRQVIPPPDGGPQLYALLKYERRNFYKWEEVSGDNPAVANNDVTSSTNGAGAFVGAKLGDLPAWGMVGAYYAGGLSTATTLQDGRRIQGDVDDYALGAGVRLLFGEGQRLNRWAWLSEFYQWNVGDFDEFSSTNASLGSTRRTHKSFTGEYGVGATYWVQPRIGLDLGLSYNGQFNKKNADENLRVGVGVIVSGTDNFRR